MGALLDLAGQVFGRYTVIERVGTDKSGQVRWLCECSCGNRRVVLGKSLARGHSKSCGCLRVDVNRDRCTTHGATLNQVKAPEYRAFYNAKTRCQNPRCASYADYGGRGIEFRFDSYAEWLQCLGPRPSARHSVDRIDNDSHYEPGNVRWATPEEQRANQRCACANCSLLAGHERSIAA